MKQILDINQIVGKTISKTIDGECELFIKFSDESFCVFRISDKTEGYGYSRNIIELDDYAKDKTCLDLIKLGVITKDEYDIACKEQDEEWDRIRDERLKEEKLRQDEYELSELKRLQEKFK